MFQRMYAKIIHMHIITLHCIRNYL